MFWCDECKCAYPHGPEGPSGALEEHTARRHRVSPRHETKGITGRQVIIALLVLAFLSWIVRFFDFDLT